MMGEIITDRPDLVIRRMILQPGEASPWHVDRCHRFTVVVQGEQITIEFRDSPKTVDVPVGPGVTGWDEPDDAVHPRREQRHHPVRGGRDLLPRHPGRGSAAGLLR